jgi:prepilin-type N-terminal cleavage/methylation domain-containing protein
MWQRGVKMNAIPHRRGFTMTELLFVIIIIVILVGILIPVVGRVRQSAYEAETQSLMMGLANAIEAYHHNFRAYPGPLSDDQMFAHYQIPADITRVTSYDRVTSSENLVLGLLGGLEREGDAIVYKHQNIGTGPQSLRSTGATRRYPPFFDGWVGHLSGPINQAFYSDREEEFGRTGSLAAKDISFTYDSNIPEFIDSFRTRRMPILYLRARVGLPGIMSDSSTPRYQYDIRQIHNYTRELDPSNAVLEPHPGNGKLIFGTRQGLYELGSLLSGTQLASYHEGNPGGALRYFRHPQMTPRNTDNEEQANATGTPRQKDTFILISAGRDRIFGTGDDITNFGRVVP